MAADKELKSTSSEIKAVLVKKYCKHQDIEGA